MSPIDKHRWQAVSPYLDQALAMEAEELAGWLAAVREEDPTLAADLRYLLEEAAAADRERFLEDGSPPLPSADSLAGQTLGAYTLVAPIGQGGMGSVWLARRSDGRFEGQVAVKLLNAELMGRVGHDRFVREGSILARLTHPHVARLLDAGVSSIGQPYLVLEHVEGTHVDRYCDDEGLDVEGRLHLFLDVLEAVAHAHANLIVHRDIKPSNVLVDDDGQVKLLDFGIAKLLATDGMAGEATALTLEGGRALTPEFAAPEQLTGGPITTATDVHALGSLLYVLLVGRHPVEAALASPAELFKAITDTQPRRVSDAVVDTRSQTLESLVESAARRSTTPERLRHRLRGDLDTIVAKALKKEPAERYPSVSALADDVRRHLEHQPIGARPDTLTYRAVKLVRRHRLAVALIALAFFALVGGLAGTITQARRATRQATIAESERQRADQAARGATDQRDFALRQRSRAETLNDLNQFVLSDAAASGKPFPVGELLSRAEEIVSRQTDQNVDDRVEVLVALGRQYWLLDENERARRTLVTAHDLAIGASDASVRAKAACALAPAEARAGDLQRAERLLEDGLAQLTPDPQLVLHRVFCLLRGGEVARWAGYGQLAIERVEEAQRLLRNSTYDSALLDLRVAMDLAESYRLAARFQEADAAFAQAAERLRALGRDDTVTAGTLWNNWALVAIASGRPLDAERRFRRAIAIESGDLAAETVSPLLLNNLATTLLDLHRLEEARDLMERALVRARAAGDEMVVNQILLGQSSVYRQLSDLDRSRRVLAELAPRLRRMHPPGHIALALLASEEAQLAQARGDVAAAHAAHDRAVAIADASPRRSAFLPHLLVSRSGCAIAGRRFADARSDAALALDMERRTSEPGVPSSGLGLAHLALGRALAALGDTVGAREAFASALEQLEPTLGAEHPATREAALGPGSQSPV